MVERRQRSAAMNRSLPPVEVAITCDDGVMTTVSVSDFPKVTIHSNVNVVLSVSRSIDDTVCLNRENPEKLPEPLCQGDRDSHSTESRESHSPGNRDNCSPEKRDIHNSGNRDNYSPEKRDIQNSGNRDNYIPEKRDIHSPGNRDNYSPEKRDIHNSGNRDNYSPEKRDIHNSGNWDNHSPGNSDSDSFGNSDNHSSENQDLHSSRNRNLRSSGSRNNHSDSKVTMATGENIPVAFVQPYNNSPDINKSSDLDHVVYNSESNLGMIDIGETPGRTRNAIREELSADTLLNRDLDHGITKQRSLADTVTSLNDNTQGWSGVNSLPRTVVKKTESESKPSSEAAQLDDIRSSGTLSCVGDALTSSPPAVIFPTMNQELEVPAEETYPKSDTCLLSGMITSTVPNVPVASNIPDTPAPNAEIRTPSMSSATVPFDMGQSIPDFQEHHDQDDSSGVDLATESLHEDLVDSSSSTELLEYSPSEFQTPSSVISLIVAPFGSFTPPNPEFQDELEETDLLPDARTRATTYFKNRSPKRAAYPSRPKVSGSGGRHSFHVMGFGSHRRITSLLDLRSKSKILRETLELSEQQRSRDRRRRVNEANRRWKAYDADVTRDVTRERVRFANTATLRIVLEEKLPFINRVFKLFFSNSDCLGKNPQGKPSWEPILEEYEFKMNL